MQKEHLPKLRFWKRANDFGEHYLFLKLRNLKADAKRKYVIEGVPKDEYEEVYLCENKKGHWLSFVYGHSMHFETPETINYAGWWFDKEDEWKKITKEVNIW